MRPSPSRADIFLSYAREDRERARLLYSVLGRQGWQIFMDEDTSNATRFEEHILHNLEISASVLVLWSEASRRSEWVKREAAKAIEQKKLVHATLDGQPPPGPLAAYQANDLSGWDGETTNLELLRVLGAVASHIGIPEPVGTLHAPRLHEPVTSRHLALTSTSWRKKGDKANKDFPFQIHLMLVGSRQALDRVENVLYFFDPAYAANRPEFVDRTLKAYVVGSNDRRNGFGVYELANGYSVVRATVKVMDQAAIIHLSRFVDIFEESLPLKERYPQTLLD